MDNSGGLKRGRGPRGSKDTKPDFGKDDSFVETVLSVRRVSKVITGGRRFAFSALVVVGDGKGSAGVALGKGRDVSASIAKAVKKARKSMVKVPLYGTTVPFTVLGRYGASKVIVRSACKGTGVMAGGAVRLFMEAVGIKDVLAKVIGSVNSQNTIKALLDAFSKMRSAGHIARLRGKSVAEIFGKDDNSGVKDAAAA